MVVLFQLLALRPIVPEALVLWYYFDSHLLGFVLLDFHCLVDGFRQIEVYILASEFAWLNLSDVKDVIDQETQHLLWLGKNMGAILE